MSSADWIWMPHPGHLCVAWDCKFRMNTKVGGYIVSTIGEWCRKHRQPDDEEFEDIGCDRKYETMVFQAIKATDIENPKEGCCPWRAGLGELDMEGYNDPKSAMLGHIAMCEKWDKPYEEPNE